MVVCFVCRFVEVRAKVFFVFVVVMSVEGPAGILLCFVSDYGP